jgi:hypothetical protein
MNAEDILSQYGDEIASRGIQLRELLLTELKDIKEEADTKANVIGYSYGTGYKNLICVILLSKKGVKLGFYKGSELADPAGLLTGTGKVHRFVEIKSSRDINNPALKRLLREAVAAHKRRQKK